MAFCQAELRRMIAAGNLSPWAAVAAVAAEAVDSRSALSKLRIISVRFGLSVYFD